MQTELMEFLVREQGFSVRWTEVDGPGEGGKGVVLYLLACRHMKDL